MVKSLPLVRKQFHDKIYGKLASTLAVECFMKALPLDLSDKNHEIAMINYANNVYSKLNVGTILESTYKKAVESKDYKTMNLLGGYHSAIESTINTATQRAIKDGTIFDDDTDEVFRLNSDEISEFTKKKSELNIDDVAKIIKEKIIDTIKTEKNEYEKATELRGEIMKVINDTEEEAVESYMGRILSRTDPREYTSFFSKTQDVCMEAIMHTEVSDEYEVPFMLLESLTVQNSLMDVNNEESIHEVMAYLESVDAFIAISDEAYEDKLKCSVQQAFVCTICIFTIYEVLHTLKLFNPKMTDISTFINSAPQIKGIRASKLDRVYTELVNTEECINKCAKQGKAGLDQMVAYFDTLLCIKEKLLAIKAKMDDQIINACLDKLESLFTIINKCRETYSFETDFISNLGYYAKKELEYNKAEVCKYINMIERNTNVKVVEFRFNGALSTTDNNRAYVDIYGLDNDNKIIVPYMAQISLNPAFGNTLRDVMKVILGNCPHKKPIRSFLTDKQYFDVD